jgi:hypothetical protein
MINFTRKNRAPNSDYKKTRFVDKSFLQQKPEIPDQITPLRISFNPELVSIESVFISVDCCKNFGDFVI